MIRLRRPASVVLFEALFLASFALWVAVQALTWRLRAEALSANPYGADLSGMMEIAMAAVGAVSLLLWYFTARRASVLARWGVVALAACSAVVLLFGLMALVSPGGPGIGIKLMAVMTSATCVASAVFLFQPDAQTWFGYGEQE